MLKVQQNVASEIQALASDMLRIKNRLAAAAAINSIVTALNAGAPAAWTKMVKVLETMPR